MAFSLQSHYTKIHSSMAHRYLKRQMRNLPWLSPVANILSCVSPNPVQVTTELVYLSDWIHEELTGPIKLNWIPNDSAHTKLTPFSRPLNIHLQSLNKAQRFTGY